MADEDTVSTPPATETPQVAAPETPSPSPQPSTETSTDTGSSKESLLDAVLKVVPATNESDVLAPEDKEAAPEATDPDSQQAEEDQPETDDDEPVSPETPPAIRKKINKLLKQRRELRNELSQLQAPAQVGSELEQFASANALSGENVANSLQIAAMLQQGDYAAFYKAVSPYVRRAQEYLGIVLPGDLAQQVKQGQMTESVARDYARQRFDGQRTQVQLQNVEQAQQRQHVQYVQNDVKRAVSSFESRLAANDPDYKVKQPIVRRIAQAMLLERGNEINSVEDALEISRAAYDEATRQSRAFRPTLPATNPRPNGASQTPSARAAPKSLMEAATQALELSRRGG